MTPMDARPEGDRAVRTIYIDPERPFDFGEYQTNYLDYRTWRMIPSTDLYYGDYLAFQVNSLGCKGAELEGGKPVIAFFGDSVVHGTSGVSFADRVRIGPCEPLNAGVEGMLLPWIVDRFLELRDQIPMVCAAVHAGWHNLAYNEHGEDYWAEQLDRIAGPPVIAHFRLFADISPATVISGYDEILRAKDIYSLWRGADFTTQEGRAACLALIGRFNRFIEAYCRDRGRILIDLEPLMAPSTAADLGARFDDFVHPNSGSYDLMARQIEAQLGGAVLRALRDNPALAQRAGT